MREILQRFDLRFEYPVLFSRSTLDPSNSLLREILLRAGDLQHRVLPVFDSGLLRALPDLPARLSAYAEALEGMQVW